MQERIDALSDANADLTARLAARPTQQDIEDRDRAIESLQLKVDLALKKIAELLTRAERAEAERDNANKALAVWKELSAKLDEHRNALFSRAERAEAAWRRLVTLVKSLETCVGHAMVTGETVRELHIARFAVDAAGDLEGPR